MPRTAARFTKADITRALAAVEKVGAPAAVEVLPDGTIRIVPVSALTPGDSGEKPAPEVDVREMPVL